MIPGAAGRPGILITPRSLTAAGPDQVAELDPLRRAGYQLVSGPSGRTPSERELLTLVEGCVGWLAGVEPISASVLHTATALRVISRNGAGIDNLDQAAAARHGITILAAPGANATSVAELAIGLTIAALRHIPRSDRALRRVGGWQRWQGRELHGRRVGVIGLGNVGSAYAKLLMRMGCQVTGHDPMLAEATSVRPRLVEMDSLLATSDVVSLHAPAQRDGAALIGAAQLSQLPRGAVLINTARASLVDEDAVLAALDSGQLDCYATDAFDPESAPGLPLARP